MLKRFIPNGRIKKVQDLDLETFYNHGFRLLLVDLDNTLIPYTASLPDADVLLWIEEVKAQGFHLIVVSNSGEMRVGPFALAANVPFVSSAKKPTKHGLKKALNLNEHLFSSSETVLVGDQVMTDILGGNRMGLHTVLVDPIDRDTERRVTRFNRFFEKIVIALLKRKHGEAFKVKL